MQIGIIGTGYVGLVTGACFAEFGLNVICVDKDKKKIRTLKKGHIPFYEPGLDDVVQKNIKNKRLKFTTKIKEAVESSSVIFIAVGTPPRGDGSADLSYVEGVSKEISKHMNSYKIIVTKSTVPVGTGRKLKEIVSKHLSEEIDFDIVSNPEFLREGAAIEDFMRPNRVIIGAHSHKAIAVMKDLYKPLYLLETPFVITDIETAELIKYASNSFLAAKISFINEIANLCEKVGADVNTVAKGMGLDHRIGSKFLHAGPGFGGSCFPKDVKALLNAGKKNNVAMNVVKAVIKTNDMQRDLAVQKIKKELKNLKGKKIAVLGIAFKPNTDDIREAPSLFIIEKLIKYGAKVTAYDPAAIDNAKEIMPDINYCKGISEAIKGADAIVIVTEWNEFRNLDMDKIKKLLKQPYFFDLRNIYEPEKMKQLGFKYFSTGRI
ncbi:MAG: UDP-glucose/GDP-mannose dehydrogenase family protein [Nitrospiraceae bacterium]|nr:UDP-glucose/GDP-mannose dehydrogenase family protein [Nitrospiraceae bacterium]